LLHRTVIGALINAFVLAFFYAPFKIAYKTGEFERKIKEGYRLATESQLYGMAAEKFKEANQIVVGTILGPILAGKSKSGLAKVELALLEQEPPNQSREKRLKEILEEVGSAHSIFNSGTTTGDLFELEGRIYSELSTIRDREANIKLAGKYFFESLKNIDYRVSLESWLRASKGLITVYEELIETENDPKIEIVFPKMLSEIDPILDSLGKGKERRPLAYYHLVATVYSYRANEALNRREFEVATRFEKSLNELLLFMPDDCPACVRYRSLLFARIAAFQSNLGMRSGWVVKFEEADQNFEKSVKRGWHSKDATLANILVARLCNLLECSEGFFRTKEKEFERTLLFLEQNFDKPDYPRVYSVTLYLRGEYEYRSKKAGWKQRALEKYSGAVDTIQKFEPKFFQTSKNRIQELQPVLVK